MSVRITLLFVSVIWLSCLRCSLYSWLTFTECVKLPVLHQRHPSVIYIFQLARTALKREIQIRLLTLCNLLKNQRVYSLHYVWGNKAIEGQNRRKVYVTSPFLLFLTFRVLIDF